MPRMCAQLHEAAALATERAGGELAVEVPQGQPVRLDLEVGVAALAVLERVGVGHHVAAHAVGVDQLEDPGLLADLVVVGGRDVVAPSGSARRGSAATGRSRRRSPPRRAAAGGCGEEVTGLRALDDPVVVGRGQRHDLADRVAGDRLLRGALPLGRVLHRADADDRALALHQPRHGVVGADAAGVGQADRRALEVGDRAACRRAPCGRCPRRRSRTPRSPSPRRP